MLTMTEVARMIAMPTDPESERKAMQDAFKNCDVFTRLYDQTAKGQPLTADRLGGRAVHEFGVAPGKASKFIESFVESAVAAELAEQDEQGDIILWGPANDTVAASAPLGDMNATVPSPAPSQPIAQRADASTAAPTIRQVWPIDGGAIVFELRSEKALPATAFGALGEVVAKLEGLATSLVARALSIRRSNRRPDSDHEPESRAVADPLLSTPLDG